MPILLLLCPIRSPLLLLLCPYIIIVMSDLVMLWPLRLLYIERRSFHLYHQRIVHLCNVKEVAPSKRLNSKALIYLFYLFLSWFHNRLTNWQPIARTSTCAYNTNASNFVTKYRVDTSKVGIPEVATFLLQYWCSPLFGTIAGEAS